jgi:hypothetical protein
LACRHLANPSPNLIGQDGIDVKRVPHRIETPPASGILEQARDSNALWRALKEPDSALKSFEIRFVASLVAS